MNHTGALNADGNVECEINVWSGFRSQHQEWVASLLDGDRQVTAIGIWVEDTGHNDKTELHPVDVVFGAITSSLIPGDWISQLAADRGLQVGASMKAFRFALASDVRGFGLFALSERPPFAGDTRDVTFEVDLPQRPTDTNLVPTWDMKLSLDNTSTVRAGWRPTGGQQVLEVTATLQSLTDLDFLSPVTAGPPGVLLGEIVTYWGPPPPDPCPGLLKEIQQLNARLDEEPGPGLAERKKIVQELGELTKKAEQAHCF
jgi:hypothetical protein